MSECENVWLAIKVVGALLGGSCAGLSAYFLGYRRGRRDEARNV